MDPEGAVVKARAEGGILGGGGEGLRDRDVDADIYGDVGISGGVLETPHEGGFILGLGEGQGLLRGGGDVVCRLWQEQHL